MRHLRDERGSSPIQAAIIFPAVIIICFLLIQGVLWAYARNIAYTAARAGVMAGRTYDATPADGQTRAQQALDELAGNVLRGTAVSADGSSAETMRVHVRGQALTILPGFHLTVNATVTGPIERFTIQGAP
ncbi:pilus assembly protein [Streptomyces sp. SID14478]|uniref:TadE/TadG family type IV pilus assembly protein n=1 Tax=Streptomyces sp. SID14478 TaxID=2706073 RepID=UPI0013DBF98F|nr:TadE/TadG family type IV pilus assembly protein [Streptomyces sp. SID14478]NEB78985.1 pilus assembly protein [Streptomyces sp. SID14478]